MKDHKPQRRQTEVFTAEPEAILEKHQKECRMHPTMTKKVWRRGWDPQENRTHYQNQLDPQVNRTHYKKQLLVYQPQRRLNNNSKPVKHPKQLHRALPNQDQWTTNLCDLNARGGPPVTWKTLSPNRIERQLTDNFILIPLGQQTLIFDYCFDFSGKNLTQTLINFLDIS